MSAGISEPYVKSKTQNWLPWLLKIPLRGRQNYRVPSVIIIEYGPALPNCHGPEIYGVLYPQPKLFSCLGVSPW